MTLIVKLKILSRDVLFSVFYHDNMTCVVNINQSSISDTVVVLSSINQSVNNSASIFRHDAGISATKLHVAGFKVNT